MLPGVRLPGLVNKADSQQGTSFPADQKMLVKTAQRPPCVSARVPTAWRVSSVATYCVPITSPTKLLNSRVW